MSFRARLRPIKRGFAAPIEWGWRTAIRVSALSRRQSLPPAPEFGADCVLVVAPHPDDEILACGGILARHANRGGESLIVAVTDGEASHIGSKGWNALGLGITRRAESLEGLSRLGLGDRAVVRLGLPDGKVSEHSDELACSLNRLLRSTDLVVSTWQFDGHPDHDAVGRISRQVKPGVGYRLAEAPIWMWHWAIPGDPRVPWNRLQEISLGRHEVEGKQTALAAHVSQLESCDRVDGPVLDEAIISRTGRNKEYFFV